MTKRIYDLMVKSGEYETKTGETKSRYIQVGSLMESNDGKPFIFINRHINFAAFPSTRDGSDSAFVSCFEPGKYKRADGIKGESNPSSQAMPGMESDIPF